MHSAVILLVGVIIFLFIRGMAMTNKYFAANDRCRLLAIKYNRLVSKYNKLDDGYYKLLDRPAAPPTETTSGPPVQFHGLSSVSTDLFP